MTDEGGQASHQRVRRARVTQCDRRVGVEALVLTMGKIREKTGEREGGGNKEASMRHTCDSPRESTTQIPSFYPRPSTYIQPTYPDGINLDGANIRLYSMDI